MTRYALAALSGLLFVAVAWAYVQSGTINGLRADNAALRLAVEAAQAKQANIAEDKKTDAEIDNIPDDGLRIVPDHWLRPAPGSGGIY